MERIVDPSVVSIAIYITINNKWCLNPEELTPIKIELIDEIKQITKDYMFYKGVPYFETVSFRSTNLVTENKQIYYLAAEIDVGDSIEDEWMIVNALYTLSKKHSNYIFHIEDGDGYFLLIEAAKELPDWMDPSTMENRFFLRDGHFLIIPHPSFSSFKSLPVSPTIEQSLQCIRNNQVETFPAIEKSIQNRIQSISYPNTHTCNCLLPHTWANLIKQHPTFLRTFAHCYLQANEMERQQSQKALETLPQADLLVHYTITLPRLLFIHLISTAENADGPQVQHIGQYLSLSSSERAHLLGTRLYKGALLFQPPQVRARVPREESLLQYALTNNFSYKEYCQLEESRIPADLEEVIPVETPAWLEEDLTWLEVTEQDVNAILKAGEDTLRETDIDLIIEEEKAGKDMLQSVKTFVSGVSNVEGIDAIPREGGERPVVPVNVDFEMVMDLLKGVDLDLDEEPVEPVEPVVQPSIEENIGETLFEEEDMDLDMLSNLIQSYVNQPSVEGPVQSMMASMGLQMPSRSCVCFQTMQQNKYSLHSNEQIISSTGLDSKVDIKTIRSRRSFTFAISKLL